MGAIITFGASLILLSGFLSLKVWEQENGKVFGEQVRRTLDTWALRYAEVAVDAPPKFSAYCLCALRDGVSQVRIIVPRLYAAVRGRTQRLVEDIRARRLSQPRVERGEASEFLKNVTEHKNGIRNGNSQ